MVVRISDKTQNYSKVTKLLVKPFENRESETIEIPSNGEISDKIIDPFIDRYNAQ